MEATFPVGVGNGNHEFSAGSHYDVGAYLLQIPTDFTMEDLLSDESGAGHTTSDPHSSGDTSNYAAAADAREVNATHILSAAAVEDIPPVLNAGLARPQPEAPVRGACGKRKKLVCASSRQRSKPPEFDLVELPDVPVQSDPSSTDTKPPTGSTDGEIIRFLRSYKRSLSHGTEVNLSLGEQDQMAPKAVRSYVTTVTMMPDPDDQKTHVGYWKEKRFIPISDDGGKGCEPAYLYHGLKRTLQFHRYDGTKTNWFMNEYIPTSYWAHDLFMERFRFREVYEGAEVPVPDEGEPTSPEVKIKNKIAVVKKHRMRGPKNLVIKGESPAWQHLIKIYDRHPELEGSKVVYALCCHCQGVLKAGTENGTKSLLTHCNRTCPIKNKNQQPSSSSYQEHLFGVP